jgi:hypothetical protein
MQLLAIFMGIDSGTRGGVERTEAWFWERSRTRGDVVIEREIELSPKHVAEES